MSVEQKGIASPIPSETEEAPLPIKRHRNTPYRGHIPTPTDTLWQAYNGIARHGSMLSFSASATSSRLAFGEQ